jgi:hypothetical protein
MTALRIRVTLDKNCLNVLTYFQGLGWGMVLEMDGH